MINFFTGFIMGLVYSMPIGTENMFVINCALTQKRKKVLLVALIVSIFDISLIVGCFFGISAIINMFPILQFILLGVGSLIIIIIGIGIIKSSVEIIKMDSDITVQKIITTSFATTWCNVQAIVDGTILLGGYRVSHPGIDGILFLIGVCIASMSWWFGMSTVVNTFHSKINEKIIRVVNVICGIIIILYGVGIFKNFVEKILPYF